MTAIGGPNLITDGLVFCIDAANTDSYPGTGTIVTDITSNVVTNTDLKGGATYDSNFKGNFLLDGVNGYILTTLKTSDWFSNNDPFTVSIMVKIISDISQRSGLFNNQLYSTESTPGGFGISITDSGNYICYLTSEVGEVKTQYSGGSLSMTVGSWKYITFTYDPLISKVKSYRNDSLVTTTTNGSYNWTTEARNSQIGRNTQGGWSTYYYNMNLGHISVYTKALTLENIVTNFDALKGRYGI